MTTSGTKTFDPDFADIIEEAFERAGREMHSAYDLRTARRALDIMSLEWANRQINLWTVTQATIPLVAGTASYNLPTDCIDIIEHQVRTGTGLNQVDFDLFRLSVSGYAALTNKNARGKPTQVYINRQQAQQTITVWQIPDVSTYTLVYHYIRRIQDTGAATNTADVPGRFIPALVAGLAFYIAMKSKGQEQRVPYLKQYYEEQLQLATDEDRTRASWYIHPHIASIG